MAAITPIPTARVSDQLIRSRLLSQLQFDQRDLFRIQTQVATGRRIFVPSEDAPAAQRAISLQRLIERKTQMKVNLQTNQSYLRSTDSSLGTISSILADVRGSAISVADTTSSQVQRDAVVEEVQRAIQQLLDTGNQEFRGRYLFAGSRTTQRPFELVDGKVLYTGNESELQSYSDIDVLFESGLHGNAVFGAISAAVLGSNDLNPVLTAGTKLSDLRGGIGVGKGSISVSDGTNIRIIDLNSAETIGDVARLIEKNPPGSDTLTVTITPTGLQIEREGGGTLAIGEVSGGTAARELGILNEAGSTTGVIDGLDLNPRMTLTTRLEDMLGARALTRVHSAGANNDLLLEATAAGAAWNNVRVQFVDDDLLQAGPGLNAGSEIASYDPAARAARASLSFGGANNDLILTADTAGSQYNGVTINMATQVGGAGLTNGAKAEYNATTKVLTVTVDSTDAAITADAVRDAIEASTPFDVSFDPSVDAGNDGSGTIDGTAVAPGPVASTGTSGGDAGTLYVHIQPGETTSEQVVNAINAQVTQFRATTDPRDAITTAQEGAGTVDLTATGLTFGGSGIVFDKASGVRVSNGGENFDLSFAAAETVEDLLNVFNGSGAGVLAQINASGSGLDVRSRLSGADFSIGENGGATATQLGIRSFTGATPLAELNHGRGVQIIDGVDFSIVRNDGVRLDIDLSGATTVQDVLNRINNHTSNTGATVVARLSEFGNGIELVDDNPAGLDTDGNPNTLRVLKADLGLAAVHLGFVVDGESESVDPVAAVAASGTTDLINPNTNLVISARSKGTAFNDVRVEFVNSAAVGDQALVSYNAGTKTLTIDVEFGTTRALTVRDAINDQIGGNFTAELDTTGGANDGSGVIAAGDAGLAATLEDGAPEVFTTADTNPIETSGIFNSLLRLQEALSNNDLLEIQRTVEMLDVDLQRVNFSRGEIGARQKGLDVLQFRLDSEEIELRGSLSEEIEVDLTQAITDLTARQAAFEAALRATAGVLQLSLLNYL